MAALWRGYVGQWELHADRLYLTGISHPGWAEGHDDGTTAADDEASLRAVFPDANERVFAGWFSGTLRIPEGECVEYVHAGFASRYERDCLVTVNRGVITSEVVRENPAARTRSAGFPSSPKPDGPDRWLAMPLFRASVLLGAPVDRDEVEARKRLTDRHDRGCDRPFRHLSRDWQRFLELAGNPAVLHPFRGMIEPHHDTPEDPDEEFVDPFGHLPEGPLPGWGYVASPDRNARVFIAGLIGEDG